MTETTTPLVQAIQDAIEAAIAATATELSQAVGCPCPTAHFAVGGPHGVVGPATADQIRDRVERLKNTIRRYLHWTSAAIKVMNSACRGTSRGLVTRPFHLPGTPFPNYPLLTNVAPPRGTTGSELNSYA
jgi:hypothetical protein